MFPMNGLANSRRGDSEGVRSRGNIHCRRLVILGEQGVVVMDREGYGCL